VNRWPIVPVFAVLLNGCRLATDRDVRAYDTCLARHPQEVVLCEGPRQAYEINPSTFEARFAAIPGRRAENSALHGLFLINNPTGARY